MLVLIALNTLTFVLASEPGLYGPRGGCDGDAWTTTCFTAWRWVFVVVEWTTAIVFTVECVAPHNFVQSAVKGSVDRHV